jgi:plastocyanin
MRDLPIVMLLFAAVLIAGCSGESAKTSDSANAPAGSVTTPPKGDTIVVEAHSDENGNYFKPNEIEAEQGDVLRFVVKSGVHNVHFLPDSNSIKTGLPPASDLLQLPDQTYDLPVPLAPGRYYFQCDPHAPLGMKAHLKVEKE